jgi:hypothetical protein
LGSPENVAKLSGILGACGSGWFGNSSVSKFRSHILFGEEDVYGCGDEFGDAEFMGLGCLEVASVLPGFCLDFMGNCGSSSLRSCWCRQCPVLDSLYPIRL